MRHFPSLIAGLALFLPAMSSPLAAQIEPTPVYIEDSPDADDLVKQAQVLREQKRLTETAAMYQKVADTYPRKLMKVDGPVHVDGIRWVRLTVAADVDLLAAYRALHEPVAARAVDQASTPTPKLADLEIVAQRFALCESGLEAALRGAALHLERGSAIDAINLLNEFSKHPDFDKHKTRWLSLAASAAVYARDESSLQAHLKTLRDSKAFDEAKQVETLKTQLHEASGLTPRSSLTILPQATVPQPLGKPLYTRETQTESDTPRGPSTDPSRRPDRSDDHHMIPTVAGDTLYINTGLTLRAMDRSSLSDVWSTPFSPGVVDGTAYDRFGVLVREQAVRDQRGVMVDGEFVTAVMGRVTSTGRGQVMASTPDTLLVCVSKNDGKPLWKRTAEQFDATLTQSFFHGTPVGGEGRAYVLVRRSQNSGFRDAYILAIDLRSGTLAWKRHLSSTTPGYTSRGFTHLLSDRGRLFVSDNLGAVACLDGRTGTMIWFHRMSQFKALRSGASSTVTAAWNVSPPVLVKAGLVVSPFMMGVAGTLIDAETGKKIRDLETDAITKAAYLMEVNGDVLSVGSNVALLDGASLDEKWTAVLGDGAAPAARGIVMPGSVMIPTNDKIITLNLATGKKESEFPLESPGNLLALDGQMLITSGTTVRSFMTWPVVYANLTSRIRKEPTDAQPGLALAHAALASAKNVEALEGVDHVVAVLRHRALTRAENERPETDEIHAEIFQQLLRLSDSSLSKDTKLRGEIFDRVAKATVTPRDEVQYHLSFAAYLVESDWPADQLLDRRRDAVRHFQTVLESPILSAQMVPRTGGWQQGGVEARMKLAGMIEKYTRTVYEEFDDRAAEELGRLTIGNDPDPAALIELTRKYPLAKASGAAMLAAGEALAKGGRHVDAITQLRRAFREKSATALRARIIGRLVEQYARIGKPTRARQWLMRAERENIQPVREGKAVAAHVWLAELGTQQLGAAALPELASKLGKPTLLAGALMLPRSQPREQWPLDRALLAFGDQVQLRGGPAFERIWEAKLEPGAELLWLNDTLALFWSDNSQTLLALDARNGKNLWPPLKAQTLLKEMLAAGQLNEDGARPSPPGENQMEIRPGGRVVLRGGVIVDVGNDAPLLFAQQFGARSGPAKLSVHGQPVQSDPWFAERQVRVIVNDAIVCVVDSAGRVIGIDMDSGQIKWRFVCPFDRLDQIAISGECVAFAGGMQAQANTETETSVIAALDALTGDVIAQVEAPGTLMWLGLSEGDALIYVSQPIDRREKSKVVVHQLPDGELHWRGDLTTGRIDAVTLAGESILVLVDGSDLIVVDPITRTVRDPLSSVMIDRTDGVDVAAAGAQWHVLTPTLVTGLKNDTGVLWRDGIDEEAGTRILQLVGRENMLVVTFAGDEELLIPRLPPAQRLPDPRLQEDFTVTYRLFLLDRKGGSILQEYRLPLTAARIDAQQSVLLNQHVLLGVGSQTMVVPGEK